MTELRRIMHIEDDPDIREITRMSLELVGGFDVIQFEGGDIALENLPDDAPDMILLDVMMPKVNGYTVCQQIRETSQQPHQQPKIIMLTAKGRDAEITKGLALGADAYITKPFSTRDLVSDVQKLLSEA